MKLFFIYPPGRLEVHLFAALLSPVLDGFDQLLSF